MRAWLAVAIPAVAAACAQADEAAPPPVTASERDAIARARSMIPAAAAQPAAHQAAATKPTESARR
jgi:hypothetical protein